MMMVRKTMAMKWEGKNSDKGCRFETWSFEGSDKLQLAAYKWLPLGETKAVAVLVHGLGEHALRFIEYASFFASQGTATFSMDLPGHGRSPGKRGHMGDRALLLKYIESLMEAASAQYPGRPLFLYGHSMGGTLVLSFRLFGKIRPNGYIVTSPWLMLKRPVSTSTEKLLKGLARFKPDMIIRSPLNLNAVTSVPEEISLYREDSLLHTSISLQTAVECWDSANEILRRGSEKRGRFLLFHGTDDRICLVEGSRKLALLAQEECIYREWPQNRHELQHDRDKLRVRQAIAQFMEDAGKNL